MYKSPTYESEQAHFTAAVDGLLLARRRGLEVDGLAAYLALNMRGRRPLLQFSYEEIYNPEHKRRLREIGHFVELAAELSEASAREFS